MYMKMSFIVSTPPEMTRSLSPRYSSLTPIEIAENDDAHAASVTQLVPPRSSRLAIRPATTLPSRPGKVLSVQARMQVGDLLARALRRRPRAPPRGACPAATSAGSAGWPSRPAAPGPTVTPRMTETRERSSSVNWPRTASSSTCWATISASSCAVSVAGTTLGGTPKAMRVELDRVEEAAAPAVGLVDGRGVGVEVVVDQPVGRRHRRHPVGAGQDVPPEPGRVGGAREQRRHADDGDRRSGAGRRTHRDIGVTPVVERWPERDCGGERQRSGRGR